jgi:acetyl esterase/lipase
LAGAGAGTGVPTNAFSSFSSTNTEPPEVNVFRFAPASFAFDASVEPSKYKTSPGPGFNSASVAVALPGFDICSPGLGAPAFVVTADIDPLRDDGRTYVERLQADGVAAQYRNEAELVHGYLRARHISRRAAASFAAMGEALVQLASGGLQSEGFGV